jgi:hypothetical protein
MNCHAAWVAGCLSNSEAMQAATNNNAQIAAGKVAR